MAAEGELLVPVDCGKGLQLKLFTSGSEGGTNMYSSERVLVVQWHRPTPGPFGSWDLVWRWTIL